MDLSLGGAEASEVSRTDGTVHRFEARSCDTVEDARVVFCYAMYLGDRQISVSLTTMELEPAGDGTRLTFTEQGVFLDGADDVKARIVGIRRARARGLRLTDYVGQVDVWTPGSPTGW
jgi:uncharacterized protein YndB with AHSA1/START domain